MKQLQVPFGDFSYDQYTLVDLATVVYVLMDDGYQVYGVRLKGRWGPSPCPVTVE